MADIVDEAKAVRLARAIASDISLYNEEKVKEGIGKDTFFQALGGELDEGRDLYRSRVAAELDPKQQFFWLAVVNVIIRAKGHIKSPMW